jgi:hypothetical protein
MMALAVNPFQRRRVASQTKPMQPCHPERSEGSLAEQRSFAALRMTQRDGLVFEMDWPWRSACFPKIAPALLQASSQMLNQESDDDQRNS